SVSTDPLFPCISPRAGGAILAERDLVSPPRNSATFGRRSVHPGSWRCGAALAYRGYAVLRRALRSRHVAGLDVHVISETQHQSSGSPPRGGPMAHPWRERTVARAAATGLASSRETHSRRETRVRRMALRLAILGCLWVDPAPVPAAPESSGKVQG